ncbi:hypothetical protein WKH57_24970 [Niallia taxi]|uniref:hypothetical protein n=2 Tax=Niallia taxi TaxID=2499688 RepID=UPI00317134F8
MKKFFGTAVLSTALLTGFAPMTSASESQIESTSVNSEGLEVVSVKSSLSDGTMSAYGSKTEIGTATLTGANPLGFKPYAYAITESKSGKIVYEISAQAQSNNDGNGITKSNKASQRDTNKAKTNKLTSSTEKTTFTGTHTIKKTKSSTTVKKTTTLSKWK